MKLARLCALACLFIITACGGNDRDPSASATPTPITASPSPTPTNTPHPTPSPLTRAFRMGFTPWPYAATQEAVMDTYAKIAAHGDIIGHHLMQGIPWQAALDDSAWPQAVSAEIESRLNLSTLSAPYLALDALNQSRDDMATDWTNEGSAARSAPWDTRSFADSEVITAYTHFALALIERFQPRYFNYASEATELALNDSEKFAEFVIFAEAVYANIKAQHPELPLMVSAALKAPGADETTTITEALTQLRNAVDIIGISVYPYAFFDESVRNDPTNLSSDWLSQINTLMPDKPIAITETGWIAEDLSIAAYSFNAVSNAQKQAVYIERLLQQAQQLDAAFVLWFSVVDFDTLWEETLAEDDLAKLWKDTGLYDGALVARPGLEDWESWRLRPLVQLEAEP